MEEPSLVRRMWAEGFGTFCLVFVGTGAVVVEESTGAVSHVGVALAFALVVMAMIYALGDVSGCHINPAVTLGLWLAGRFRRSFVLPYLASQAIGALVASAGLRLLFPGSLSLGATLPAGGVLQSLVLEFVMTLILMVVILSVSGRRGGEASWNGLVIGGVIGFEALFAGPVSGASMNPVRSMAPALVSMHLDHLWIYLVAPVAGALVAVPLVRLIRPPAIPGADDSGRRA